MKTALICLRLALPAQAGERFYCNMNALSKTERARHQELSQALLKTTVGEGVKAFIRAEFGL